MNLLTEERGKMLIDKMYELGWIDALERITPEGERKCFPMQNSIHHCKDYISGTKISFK